MRNKQIEGLRGVGVVIVVIYHLFFRYQQIYLGKEGMLYFAGVFGVDIFLLISSFFMVNKSLQLSSKKLSFFVKTMVLKIGRLWPCYAAAITITFLVTRFFPLPSRTGTFTDYLLNLCFVNGYIGIPYIDAAHWYLTTLISLNVVVVVLQMLQIEHLPWPYIIWLLLGVILHAAGAAPVARLIGGNYIGITVVGISLRKLLLQDKRFIVPCVAGIGFTMLVSGVSEVLWLLIAASVVILAATERLHFLGWRVFTFAGMISYPFYLVHQNMGYVIIQYLSKGTGFTYPSALLTCIPVFLLAVAMYYCIEKTSQICIAKIKARWSKQ